MKISLKWLNEYVDVSDFFLKTEALAETLTRAGLEVESVENRAKDFEFVVTGLILSKDKHPNAEKLSLCRVTTGEGVVHQIICGAQNHKANDRVIVALPGAVLPGDFAIKKSVIRGIESCGMLCSYKELGLEKESDGIAILPETASLGTPLAQYLKLDDITFELKVTPNRADCLSHYGLAREVACLLNRPLKTIQPQPKCVDATTCARLEFEVKNSELCPRYTGRYIQNVKVGESPDWLKKRLDIVGLSSINNIVDCTNYVMMELGQPLHAFDAKYILGKKIIIDLSNKEEKFTTLDGTELSLTGEELMIKDAERSLCLAGIIGGKNSGVSVETTDIFLEAAFFAPQVIRKSSRKHGLTTDSGYRFSRGVDSSNTLIALNRATELILQVAEGEAYAQPYDSNTEPTKKHQIPFSINIISNRMGYPVDENKFKNFMTRLGCGLNQINPGEYVVEPPRFRFDLESEMDLVEEYARLYGYDFIPETLPATAMTPTTHDLQYDLSRQAAQRLIADGYQQAVNFVFVSEDSEKKFVKCFDNLAKTGLSLTNQSIHLVNPLNEEMNVMRSCLSFSLFKNCLHNFHQGNELGRLFEIGKTFSSTNQTPTYQENWNLGLMAWGYNQHLWNQKPQHPLIFEIKSIIESLLQSLKISTFTWQQITDRGEVPDFLHKGQNAVLVVEGKKIGFLGSIHPILLNENKIRVPTVVAELNLDMLLKGQPRSYRMQSFSRYQSAQRDLALVMLNTLRAGDIIKEIRKEAGSYLKNVTVFDLYEGDKLPKGQKSVAFRLIYQDLNATLQDSQINESTDRVLTSLKKKFDISVR